MDLSNVFTQKEIEDALDALSNKRYKKNFGELKRFLGEQERKENELGHYLRSMDASLYFNGLKKFSLDAYAGIKILKNNGKSRPLLIPSPKDRVILSAAFIKVRDVLASELKKRQSLGLGLEKSDKKTLGVKTTECRKVLDAIQSDIYDGYTFVLKLDFKDFFSSINRRKLLFRLKKHFTSDNEALLFRFIKATLGNKIDAKKPSEFWGTFNKMDLKNKGIPQGLSYSPLLASFYALSLDDMASSRDDTKSYRYLDDMVILCKSEKAVNRTYKKIKSLSRKLDLNLHPLGSDSKKTKMVDITKDNFEFLGVDIAKDSVFISKESIQDFKEKIENEIINKKTIKNFPNDIREVYKRFVGGWSNHYKNVCPEDYKKVRRELEEYLKGYIEKKNHSERLAFFQVERLILEKPFIIKV